MCGSCQPSTPVPMLKLIRMTIVTPKGSPRATRPTMRTVPLKSEAQLDLQALHRIRDQLMRARTTTINQLRALLLERGIAVAQGPSKLAVALPAILADSGNDLSARMRMAVQTLRREWLALEAEVKLLDLEFLPIAKSDRAAQRLAEIPGIGPHIATALVAAIADGSGFRRGRDLAAWLGLVPRQYSTGGKAKLLGISNRGNPYLRWLSIHGARGAMASLSAQPSPRGRWLAALRQRTHANVATVALANKLARIAWVVLQAEGSQRRSRQRPPPERFGLHGSGDCASTPTGSSKSASGSRRIA
jgi:transposase